MLAWGCSGYRGNQLGGPLKKIFPERSLTKNWILPISANWLPGRPPGHCSLQLSQSLCTPSWMEQFIPFLLRTCHNSCPDPPTLHTATQATVGSLSFLSLPLPQSGVWALTKLSTWSSQPFPLPACLDRTDSGSPWSKHAQLGTQTRNRGALHAVIKPFLGLNRRSGEGEAKAPKYLCHREGQKGTEKKAPSCAAGGPSP